MSIVNFKRHFSRYYYIFIALFLEDLKTDYRCYVNNPDITSMQFISIIIIILEPSTAPGSDSQPLIR